MNYSYRAYVDESGCTGFVFRDPPEKKGSTDWFVLSAIIVPLHLDREVVRLARQIRQGLGFNENHVLHFRELRHDYRVFAFKKIAAAPITISSIAINKRRIDHPDIFTANRNRLYFYAARLLLERLSWYSRDNMALFGCQSPLTKVIFEHMRKISYDDMRNYIRTLYRKSEDNEWLSMLTKDIRIHWPSLSEQGVVAHQKSEYDGLQIADLVASGIRWALEQDRWRNTEHRYAKLTRPITYKRGSNFLSYGLKFFPEAPDNRSPNSHWINKHFRG